MKTFKWILTILWVAAALTLAGQGKLTGPKLKQQTNLLIDPDLVERLEQIAETGKNEDARCIQGHYVTEDTIKLDAAFDTPWLLSDAKRASATFRWDLCPPGTLAWWHSHPYQTVRGWAEERNLPVAHWCDLSPTDRTGRRLPFALVSIRRGLTCFFWQQPDGTYARIPFDRDST